MTAYRDTGFTAIGNGAAGGFQNGRLTVIIGPLFAQIERERREGPRYVEALRGARAMRRRTWPGYGGHPYVGCQCGNHGAAWAGERADGIPEGWVTR